MNEFSGTTVLFSGGMDSTACIHLLRQREKKIRGMFVDFGQAARRRELDAVTKISEEMEFPLLTYTLAAEEIYSDGEIFGRNAFLIMSCILLTQQHSGLIAIGIHGGTPYYDCSQAFFHSISQLVEEQSNGKLQIVAPFIEWGKKDIYKYFTDNVLPTNLIYSCENGGDRPCGRCASCQDQKRLGIMLKSA